MTVATRAPEQVEITHSVLDRLSTYADLGIPEIWRWDGERLRARVLDDDGRYVDTETSRAFPFLRVADLRPFLDRATETHETSLVREFVDWVRETHGGTES